MKLMLVRVAALLAIIGGLVIPLCLGCGALGLEDTEPPHTENYTVSESTQVTVLNGDSNGDIKIETWGKDYVELTWTKSTTWGKSELANADVKVTEAPGRLDVETKLLSRNARVSVNYDIKLPKNALLVKVTAGDGKTNIAGTSGNTIVIAKFGSISVKNTSGYMDITAEKGNIRLEGTTGGAKLTTAESSIEVVNADGDIKATNSNGGITVNDCKGDMTLETSGGGIHVSNLLGCVLLARTTNAPIEISGVTAVEVAETSNADIKAEFGSVGVNGTTIKVKQGAIRLDLSSDINADMELKTLSGEVAVNSGAGTISITGEFSPQQFKGIVGTGGSKIYAETSKGRIDVYGSDAAK
jgi:hypothetical protein